MFVFVNSVQCMSFNMLVLVGLNKDVECPTIHCIMLIQRNLTIIIFTHFLSYTFGQRIGWGC